MTKERVCANGAAISRRNLLAALPASTLALSLPASAKQEDPILPLYRDWKLARKEWHRLSDMPGNENWDCPESLAADDRESAAFWAIVDMTPVSIEGIAALAHVLWINDGPNSRADDPDYPVECAWPGNKMIRAIWQAASGQDGLPSIF